MGFFDKVKNALGSKKEDVESQNSVNDEVIDKNEPIESLENNDESLNDNEEIQSEDSEEIPANEEIIDKLTPNEKIRNFKYLDDLIQSGVKEIVLDSDIILDNDEESEYKGGIKLDIDNFIIDGNGHTIDAWGLTRIFYCTGKNITIKNITLKNGHVDDGGAIFNEDGELTITDSTLTDNTAQDRGGAIDNRGKLTITSSTLTDNTARGTEWFKGGGAIYNSGKLTITDSTLTDNTASEGGAIKNRYGQLTIHDSTLTDNTAQNMGGAIFNEDGELTITDSTLTDNTTSFGGAIYNAYIRGKLTITSSTLTGNTAREGGAIQNRDGQLTIHDSTLTDNTAQEDGGAICNEHGELTITDSIFTGNTAHDGGAIHNHDGELTITESTLNNNRAINGGAILSGNEINIVNCTLIDNLQSSLSFVENNNKYDIKWNDNLISSDDVKIYLDDKCDGEYHIENNQIKWNKILSNGSHKIILELTDNNKIIMNFTYSPNIITINVNNYAELINSINKAKYAITPQYIINLNKGDYNATNTIFWNPFSNSNLIIKGNRITLNGQNTHQFIKIGSNARLTLDNIFLTNFVAVNGGAIFNEDGELTITDSTLTDNTAQDRGGAIDNRGKLTITSSTLTDNTAREGGAIQNRDGQLTIHDSTLTDNTAQEDGGAIKNKNGEITITDSLFTGNTAHNGGAIYNDEEESKLTITKSTLNKNTSINSGAICNKAGNFKIFNCEFSSNKSPDNIILNNDYLQIHDSTFKDNQSKDILLNDGGRAKLGIFNGKFKKNTIEKSVLCNRGRFCSVEKTLFQNNISNNKMNIINKSELTLTNPKIKDNGKSILNQNYMLIRKSSSELENIIYGEGTVEVDEKIIPQGENFDFGYLDKKIHENKTKEILLDHDITFENYERDFYEGGIELDIDDLIINGNGHTIDGADKSRIFIITGKNITLKNIIFKNGHTHKNYDNPLNNNGGAIKINYDANMTIENCEFINNTSEENGGAIYNGGELTIIDSTLNNNTAQEDGGAIKNKNGEITITDSLFTGNTAHNGGAIYNGSELTIIDSTLNNNRAAYAGAINSEGNSIITDCKIDDLGVTGNFEFRLKSENVGEFKSKTGESFPNVKTAYDVDTFKRLIANNYNNIRLGSDLSIGEMEIGANDIIIDGNGHTIYGSGTEGMFIVTGKNIIFKNITFSGGKCTGGGRERNNFTSSNADFNYYGGAIYVPYSGECTFINCNFKNNVVGNEEKAKLVSTHPAVYYEACGGAIYAKGTCILISCHFKNNRVISGSDDNHYGCIEAIIV